VVTGAFISWWYLSRFGLALFIGGVLFAVFWRRLNLFTSLEFYDLRFPKRAASAMRIWIAVRTSLIAMPAWTGITLLAAYKNYGAGVWIH
jgi:SSS family solute:Na+ symporter